MRAYLFTIHNCLFDVNWNWGRRLDSSIYKWFWFDWVGDLVVIREDGQACAHLRSHFVRRSALDCSPHLAYRILCVCVFVYEFWAFDLRTVHKFDLHKFWIQFDGFCSGAHWNWQIYILCPMAKTLTRNLKRNKHVILWVCWMTDGIARYRH